MHTIYYSNLLSDSSSKFYFSYGPRTARRTKCAQNCLRRWNVLHTHPICCCSSVWRSVNCDSASKSMKWTQCFRFSNPFQSIERQFWRHGNSVRNICPICQRNECKCAFDVRVEMVNHLSAALTFIKCFENGWGMRACRGLRQHALRLSVRDSNRGTYV